MKGLKIGHTTCKDIGTGVSVFLFTEKTQGAYWIAGSAPATHELVVLDAENSVENVNALVLSGGSAYGLFCAEGVMRYLTEQGIGQATPHGIVPIVPAAAIYDLDFLAAAPPTAEDAYQACLNAIENNQASGRVGAGYGATVGKLIPDAKPMTGGLGYATLHLHEGLMVTAFAVVNSVGDIRNASHIVAGAKNAAGECVDSEKLLLSGVNNHALFPGNNTTLVAIFTNAVFNKAELKRIAKAAVSGMARVIFPVFTQYDGDIVFAFSAGSFIADELLVSTMAAEVVRRAILHAVQHSEIVR